MMDAKLAAVAPRVGPQGSIELPIRSVQESRGDFLGQPIRRLERPPAAGQAPPDDHGVVFAIRHLAGCSG